MKTRVSKTWLIKTLVTNKEKHLSQFTKALAKYREQAIAHFEKELTAARADKFFNTFIHLTQPKNQTRDYDRVIGMLNESQDDIIELGEEDWKKYVQDEWQWTHEFKTTNSTYGVTDDD